MEPTIEIAVGLVEAEVILIRFAQSHGANSIPCQVVLPTAVMSTLPVPLLIPTPSKSITPRPILVAFEARPRMMMSPPPDSSRTESAPRSALSLTPLDQLASLDWPQANPSGIPSPAVPPFAPSSNPPARIILPPPDCPSVPSPETYVEFV